MNPAYTELNHTVFLRSPFKCIVTCHLNALMSARIYSKLANLDLVPVSFQLENTYLVVTEKRGKL